MTPQLYSLSALAVELRTDRRTLAKRLAAVPPAERKGRVKRWRLADVLAALEAPASSWCSRSPQTEDAPGQILDALAISEPEFVPWLHADIATLPQYAHEAGIPHEELVELIAYGFPILPPSRGRKVARVSRPHADRWRLLFAGFLHTLGGDASNPRLAQEARRIRRISHD